jgi:hypothetical protein
LSDEETLLRGGFHTLGDNGHVQSMRHRDHRGGDR